MILKEIDGKEFAKFRKNIKGGGFYQRTERKIVREKMGWKVWFLGVFNKDELVAAAFVMGKDGNLLVQMGPLMKKYDTKVLRYFAKALQDFAKEKQYVTLEIYPAELLSTRDVKGGVINEFNHDKTFKLFKDLSYSYMGRTVAVDPKVIRWMTVKDLSQFKDMAEVQASYKKNVRNKLRKISSGLKIHVLTDKKELVEWIAPLNSSNRKNGVEGWGRGIDYYEDIWDAFGDQVSFMEVRTKEDDKLVSSRIVFNFKDETETFSSGTIQELRQWNGMTYMQDWQIAECLKAGQKRINFYGIEGDFSNNNHLLEFKSGFGVIVEEYIGGFRFVVNPMKYRVQQTKRLIRRGGSFAKRKLKAIKK